LFNTKWVIFQPYHDENRLNVYMRWCHGDDDVHFLLDQHALLLHIILIPSQQHDVCLAGKQEIQILVFTHEIYDLQLFRKIKCKFWKQKEGNLPWRVENLYILLAINIKQAIHCVYFCY
jgi:hypothetical protein